MSPIYAWYMYLIVIKLIQISCTYGSKVFVYHRKAPHPIQVYGAAGSDVGILKMKHAQRPDDDRMFLYDPDFNQDLEPTDTTPNTGNMT